VKPIAHGRLAAALAVALVFGTGAKAAEIKILSSNILRGVLQEVTPKFEQTTAHTLSITYEAPGQIEAGLVRGDPVDMVLLGAPGIEKFQKEGFTTADSRVDIASNRIGVAIRAGAPRPDIGTVEAFKHMLLAAKSIVYTDPATGGTSGIQFAKVIERLGIADEVKAKSILNDGSLSAELVARGDAEIAIQYISEIVPVKGVDLVGPLPEELQDVTVVAAAVTTKSAQPEAARALIDFLTSPAAAAAITARGMTPSR
jgi:molybdate transport system substrate-binding protein